MGAADSLDPSAWSRFVVITEDLETGAELERRWREARPPRSVGVTDLLDLRSSYWRAVAPVEVRPDRRHTLEAGREAHVRVGHVLAPARFREVRLQRGGIVGQIDLYEDQPTEIKTSERPVSAVDLPQRRPAYVEQLAMYCALAEVADGRLLLARPNPEGAPTVDVVQARFRSLEAIWTEMQTRAALLRRALDAHDPSPLPRCTWRGLGCEFESAERCTCTGTEALGSSALLDELEHWRVDEVASRDLTDRVRREAEGPPPVVRRFRDLLYPRRAYFERIDPAGGSPTAALPPSGGLYRRIIDLLESGEGGGLVRVSPASGVPLESVSCRGDVPVVVKATRAWTVPALPGVISAQPQYVLELALKCASLERPSGTLIVGYERAAEGPGQLRSYRVELSPGGGIRALADARASALTRAVAEGSPSDLPPCPRWMYDSCPYRSACGCGGPAAVNR